jgi:hypothetical protein
MRHADDCDTLWTKDGECDCHVGRLAVKDAEIARLTRERDAWDEYRGQSLRVENERLRTALNAAADALDFAARVRHPSDRMPCSTCCNAADDARAAAKGAE